MEKQLLFEIHGKPIVVNLKYANKMAHRFTFNGGQIFMTISPYTSMAKVQKLIEDALPLKKIEKFNSQPYVGKDYIDITGWRHHLVVLEEGGERIRMDDFIVKKRDYIRKEMRKLALDIYTNEVRKYEAIMGINKPHEVKVTKMTAAVGKHYGIKNLITLDESLIHYSIDIIDSVVIHELCHYYYQDHSQNFYNLLLKYCPNYKELKRKLTYGERR